MKVWMPMIRTGTGAEVYTRQLARGLEARGHTVALDPLAHWLQYAPWLARARPPDGTDVILANSWSAAAFARPGLPLVSVCHLVVHDPRLRPFKSAAQRAFHTGFVAPMERRALRRATINVAVSESVAAQMRRYLGAGEVTTVLNGIDTNFFTPGEKGSAPDTPIRLLFVGNPSLRKGFDLVARILDALGPEAQFTCLGPPPAPPLPRPPGNYPGPADRAGVRAAFQEADLLLFPSRMEGCPLAVAEALSCGLPVVGCRDTAVAEIVPEGCGIIRDAEDIAGFAQGIRAMMRDPSALAAARKAARAQALKALSEDRWLAETEALLQAAIAARPPS